jgi:hypothetical protein
MLNIFDKKLLEQKKHPNLLKQGRHLISLEKNILFGFTPKAGCTGISKLFFNHIGEIEKAMSFGALTHQYRKIYSQTNPVKFEHFNSKKIVKLKFVRNPYTRAVSSYFHLIKNRVYAEEIINFIGVKSIDEISFNMFLSFLATQNLKRCDPHIGMQFLPGENQLFFFDEIIKIEELEERLDSINKKYKIKIAFPLNLKKSNHHLKKIQTTELFVGDFPSTYFINGDTQKLAIPNYKFFYNDEIKNKVENLYKLDFDAYKYFFLDLD